MVIIPLLSLMLPFMPKVVTLKVDPYTPTYKNYL